MTPTSALRFLFETRGRLSRRGLALGMLLPTCFVLLIADMSNSWPLMTFVWLVLAWPVLIATPWRRLHDMNRRGHWNLIFIAFYLIGFSFFLAEYVSAEGGWAQLFDGQPPQATDDELTANGLGGFSTILIFLPIQLFWLYLIPGTRGENRYGPPPRTKEFT
ncbi:MAG: DUF805 domain-containing protein [Pseudomonadota bacterium]